MKRLFAILLVAVLATSMAFATDGAAKSGTGTVNCTVIQALVVTCDGPLTVGPIGLGDNITKAWGSLTYTITGEAAHAIGYGALSAPVVTPSTGGPAITILDNATTAAPVAGTATLSGTYPGTGTATKIYDVTAVDATGTSVAIGTYQYVYTLQAWYIY